MTTRTEPIEANEIKVIRDQLEKAQEHLESIDHFEYLSTLENKALDRAWEIIDGITRNTLTA